MVGKKDAELRVEDKYSRAESIEAGEGGIAFHLYEAECAIDLKGAAYMSADRAPIIPLALIVVRCAIRTDNAQLCHPLVAVLKDCADALIKPLWPEPVTIILAALEFGFGQ